MGIDVLSHLPTTTALPLADAGLLFIFLVASGVTALTFAGFTVWAAYHALRVLALLLARLVPTTRSWGKQCTWQPVAQPGPQRLACPDPVCRTVNLDHALFCRQCGRMIRKPAHQAA